MGSNNVETVTVDGIEYVYSEKSGPNVPVRPQDICRRPGFPPNGPSHGVTTADWNRGMYDVFIPKELITFEDRTYVKVGESREGNRPSPGCVIRFRPNGYVRRYAPEGVDHPIGTNASEYWPSGKYDIFRRHLLNRTPVDFGIPSQCAADRANEAGNQIQNVKPKAFLTFNLGFVDAFMLLSMATEGFFNRWSPAATKDLQDSYDNEKVGRRYLDYGQTRFEITRSYDRLNLSRDSNPDLSPLS